MLHRAALAALLIAASWGNAANGSGLPEGAACILNSPLLDVGASPVLSMNGVVQTTSHRVDQPAPIEMPRMSTGTVAGQCQGNSAFRFGSGLYDTAGPIGGDPTGHADFFGEVVPPQIPNGIHMRPFARAFAIESPCNGKRVMFVSVEMLAISALLRQEVLKAVAAEPALGASYGPDNLMLSATHTHEVGGGFGITVLPDLSNTAPAPLNAAAIAAESLFISNPDYDDDNFKAIVRGIVQAMRRAEANLAAHPETAPIAMSIGALLNANVNRDPPAYQQNAPSERARYVDAAGNDVDVDKRFLQLALRRADGGAVGVINWFAVHPTAMGNHDLLMSSDSKGFAALHFEKLMGTAYAPDAGGMPSGADNFVAAFAQTDEGDAVPDLFVFDKDPLGGDGPGQGVPYRYRGGTDDPYAFNEPGYQLGAGKFTEISGTKQLAQALRQFAQGAALSGPVDYRFFLADLSADPITDPVILAGLGYPDEPPSLYAQSKTTCTSGYGLSQFAGGVNAPVFGAAGYACVNDAPSPYFQAVRTHYNGLYNGTGAIVAEKNDQTYSLPFDSIAAYTIATPALCLATQAQSGYGCQLEKPVTAAANANPVPIQIFRIGNLAVIGVPLEVTTMAGRRLRQTVLDALAPIGVDTAVIAGLSNDYHDYLATREEYAAQMYEGASTIFGPWELAAIQQETRKLALTMAQGAPAPRGAAAPVLSLGPPSPVTIDPPSEFGKVLIDALPLYHQSDVVDVSFVAGYPGNDLKTMSSYIFAERQNGTGDWDPVAVDRDGELLFLWNENPGPLEFETHVAGSSSAEAIWTIPRNAKPGLYRIRHDGVFRLSAAATPQPYRGISSSFLIEGQPAACP